MKGSVIHKQGICEVHHFVKSYVEKQLKNSIFQCTIAGSFHILQFIISEESKDSENLEKYMHIRTKAKKNNTISCCIYKCTLRIHHTKRKPYISNIQKCCQLWEWERKRLLSVLSFEKPSVMVWGCVNGHGVLGNFHICEGNIKGGVRDHVKAPSCSATIKLKHFPEPAHSDIQVTIDTITTMTYLGKLESKLNTDWNGWKSKLMLCTLQSKTLCFFFTYRELFLYYLKITYPTSNSGRYVQVFQDIPAYFSKIMPSYNLHVLQQHGFMVKEARYRTAFPAVHGALRNVKYNNGHPRLLCNSSHI